MFACLVTAVALTGCSSGSSADLETLQGQTLELETTTSAAPSTTAAGSRDAERAATTTTAALQASTTTTTTVRDGTGPTTGSPGISVDANAVRPGDPLTISAGGFSRSSNVRIELHSDPVLLAEVVADANGSIEIEVEIPVETPLGDHELVVVGVEPDSTRLEYRTGIVVDGDGPEMPEFSVSSTSVEPGDSLTLSIRAIDATGVALVGFSMELNGATIEICDYYQMSLASGDATDGIWTYTCTIPETVQGGTYTAIPYAQDTVGNWTNSTSYPTQTTFTVQSS